MMMSNGNTVMKRLDTIVRYSVVEKETSKFFSYTINLTRGELFISGEVKGSTSWNFGECSLKECLKNCTASDLLRVMFDYNIFDENETVRAVSNVVETYVVEKQNIILNEIAHIVANDKYEFMQQLETILVCHNQMSVRLQNIVEESIVYRYPNDAELACCLFINEVLPLLEEGDNNG